MNTIRMVATYCFREIGLKLLFSATPGAWSTRQHPPTACAPTPIAAAELALKGVDLPCQVNVSRKVKPQIKKGSGETGTEGRGEGVGWRMPPEFKKRKTSWETVQSTNVFFAVHLKVAFLECIQYCTHLTCFFGRASKAMLSILKPPALQNQHIVGHGAWGMRASMHCMPECSPHLKNATLVISG